MCQVKAGVAVGKRNCLLGLWSTESGLQYLLGSSGVTNVDNLLVCASCIKWLGIKRSLEAPNSAAGEAKCKSSIFITQDFFLRISHGVPSKETRLGHLAKPGTPEFMASPGLYQVQCGTEASNSLIHSVRKAQKGQALF